MMENKNIEQKQKLFVIKDAIKILKNKLRRIKTQNTTTFREIYI